MPDDEPETYDRLRFNMLAVAFRSDRGGGKEVLIFAEWFPLVDAVEDEKA